MAYISICIPTHEMGGLSHQFLRHSFEILERQTFKDFDVVVSDHSKDNAIQNLCAEFNDRFTVHYCRNTEGVGLSSPNINNAISKATGTLIKILFLDDFLYDHASLQDIVTHFDISKDRWLITACEHSRDGRTFYRPFYPRYTNRIHLGFNTISSPSVLTIKNDTPLLFDNNLIWLMDVEYYKRLYNTFGEPKILNSINVVNRTGEHQGIGGYRKTKKRDLLALQEKEYLYVLEKYEHGLRYGIYRVAGFLKYFLKRMF